jgi:3-deoxy-7-phosphoheptulonate synthase
LQIRAAARIMRVSDGGATMIIVLRPDATPAQVRAVERRLADFGLRAHRSPGATRTLVGAIGKVPEGLDPRAFRVLAGVQDVVRISAPYKLAGRALHPDPLVIELAGLRLGGPDLVLMAGPCAVESRRQIAGIAAVVAAQGVRILRGGAFKPRTSPYAFQGLGEKGLALLREAADRHGLAVVTEVMEVGAIATVARYADVLQVGARNMQNFPLLKALGAVGKPVLLKRGPSATIEELLMSAEYVLAAGNPRVILCERGIRTFETATRNTMDVSAIPVLKKLTHLPVVADPSHGTGLRDQVIPMARASVAAGADGVIVEVHTNPDEALSDGPQSLFPEQLARMVEELRIIGPAVGKTIPRPRPAVTPQPKRPPFRRAVVVGLGLIGGSVALGLTRRGLAARVVGVDRARVLTAAKRANAIAEGFASARLGDALRGADLVVLATPVGKIARLLKSIGPHLAPGAIVTDVGSTKVAIHAAAAALPKSVHFIGGHPMAGSQKRGIEHADALMFTGAAWTLSPSPTVPASVAGRLDRAIGDLGARTVRIDPARHDRIAAAVSHLPLLTSVALMNLVGGQEREDPLTLRLAGSGLRDMTRIAGSPADLWDDILETNLANVRELVDALAAELVRVERTPGGRKRRAVLGAAAAARLGFPESTSGFLHPLADVYVGVRDDPGELARLTTLLYRNDLDIKDIQILKIREHDDGSLRLSFATKADADHAVAVLRAGGYSARVAGR